MVCAGLALLLSGCIFSPTKGPGGGGTELPKYEIPKEPDIVLTNLKKAYTARDTMAYRACFDLNYVGTSQDQTTQNPIDTLTFADEAQHIAGLARSPKVTSVELQLMPDIVRTTDPGDPLGWALIQNPVHDLAIYENTGNTWVLAVGSETIEFRFIPKTPDSSSPTDTTWKIIKWTEIKF